MLERTLRERFTCARCRYDLGGLSIRDVCPECGLPIRATLLAVVDPAAQQFRPLHRPRATAAALLLWSGGGLACAMLVWLIRGAELLRMQGGRAPEVGLASLGAVAALAISGLGAIALIRPHGGMGRGTSLAALIGVVCYVPMLWIMAQVLLVGDRGVPAPFFASGGMALDRVVGRLGFGLAAIGAVLGLRAHARTLASRSLLLRSGRVDRQTMLAVGGAFGVAMLGDLAHLLGRMGGLSPDAGDFANVAGTVLIVIGSLLITLGLAGVVRDTVRLYPALVRPPLSLEDVTRRPEKGEPA
ncbi:MAG: hypothetical protein EA378_11135 [Phycisphaerales bacterium]|nr:MAG: hypothetical protein EA378_11135 [Phycisphaerales bacterium]